MWPWAAETEMKMKELRLFIKYNWRIIKNISSFLGFENRWIGVQTKLELFMHRDNRFSFGVCSIWYNCRKSRWSGEEKQTWLYIQLLTSRSDLKIAGLGINIYKVIDATRRSKFVKNKQVCEMRGAAGLGNSIKHKYIESGEEMNVFKKSKSKHEETNK